MEHRRDVRGGDLWTCAASGSCGRQESAGGSQGVRAVARYGTEDAAVCGATRLSATAAQQDKQRREEALAQATGLRVLKAIGDAVPVRLMKRDLLFAVARLAAILDERRVAILVRQHGIGKPKSGETPAKLLAAFLQKADESTLGRALVETALLLSMRDQADTARVLRDAAQVYKVDIETITAQVKQEFAAKEKARSAEKTAPKPSSKVQPKSVRKPSVA
jgi:ParB family chromosome partitioning protein